MQPLAQWRSPAPPSYVVALIAFPCLGWVTAARAQEPLELKSYVATVLGAHPIGREADALEDAAEGRRITARALDDPTLSAGWDQGRLRAPGAGGFDEWAFAVTQTLPWPGSWSARARAGEHSAETLRAEATLARWELDVTARLAYARLRFARAALEIARESEADARSLRDLVRTRAELGEAREADRIKAHVEWLREHRRAGGAEREAATAERLMRTLAASPLPEPLLLAASPPLPRLPPDDARLRQRLLETNPRLRASLAAARRDEAETAVARRERIPDLDVTVFHERELEKTATGVAVGFRVPLWGASRGRIALADADAARSRSKVDGMRLRLLADLDAALGDLEVAVDQAKTLEDEILPAARRSLELARLSFDEGETSLLDLLDTQRSAREAHREAAAARLALAESLGRVQRLVGPDCSPWS